MNKTILKWCILMVLLGYTTFIAVWVHGKASKEVCRGYEIEVKGESSLKDEVEQGLDKELKAYPQRIAGTPILKLNAAKIEKHLAGLNLFENVSCMLTSDNKLLVEAQPLVPVMRVFSNGKSYYINKTGKYIEARPEFFMDVPVVSGKFTKKFTPREVVPLVAKMKKDEFLNNLTGMIVANDSHNILLVPRIRGHVVNLGDTTRLDEKLEMLQLFYRKVLPKKGWNEYDTISVKFKDQIVATRRIKPVIAPVETVEEEIDLEEQTLPEVRPIPETHSTNGSENENE